MTLWKTRAEGHLFNTRLHYLVVVRVQAALLHIKLIYILWGDRVEYGPWSLQTQLGL